MNRRAVSVVIVLFMQCAGNVHAFSTADPPQEFSGLPLADPEFIRASSQSMELGKAAENQMRAGKLQEGEKLYNEAIKMWGGNTQAHYGLAQCYLSRGSLAKAIEQYRLCVYIKSDEETELGGFTNQQFELALLLSQAGLDEEARFVYNLALSRLNYRDGKQYVKVLLPEFGLKPSQRTYIPAHFQAIAHVAIAKTINDDAKALEHLKEAVKVYPKSGVAQFYLAERLSLTSRDDARAAYEKAKQLDPKAVGQEADKAMTTGLFWRPPTTP